MRVALVTLITACLLSPIATTATPPVVDAGQDVDLELGFSALLEATATDADLDPIVGYQWTVESAPVGSTHLLSTPNLATTQFDADLPGEYVVSVIAYDTFETSLPDFVTVTVYEILPPVALATSDVTEGPAPLTVNFDGSASTVDPRAGTLSYSWNFGDGQLGSGAVTSHTYSSEGTYLAKLTVADSLGQPDLDFIVITVLPPLEFVTDSPDFGMGSGGFGLPLSGPSNIPVTVEFKTNLPESAWSPLHACDLTNGAILLIDPGWTNRPASFYRVRSP